LSVAVCGTNTWGPDIGGFFATPSDAAGPRSRELWIRWCQFGALTPVMRDHLGAKRRWVADNVDLWTDAETIDTWRRYARLHNALVPYLYAYAAVAHRTGMPTLRHLVLHDPDDPEVLRQDHTYLLGGELLVAPVVEEHARVRQVYLPAGRWVSFWDESVFDGPGYRDVPAPLEQIPLLVRAGSVLPLAGRPTSTLAWTQPDELLEDLHLYVYPAGGGARSHESSFTFHDGSSVQLSETPGQLTLQLDGAPVGRRYAVRLPSSCVVSDVFADGAELSPALPAWSAEPRGGATWLRLPPAGVRRVDLRYRWLS
jgi:alpha-glucosidase (family GH31 glycosyl hydrolase)